MQPQIIAFLCRERSVGASSYHLSRLFFSCSSSLGRDQRCIGKWCHGLMPDLTKPILQSSPVWSGQHTYSTCYATTVATLAASSILCTQSCWVCSSCCSQACVMGAVRVFRGVLPACFKVGRAATVRVQIRVEQGPTLSAAGAYLWHCFTLLCALYMAVPCCMWSTARLIKASCMVAVQVQIFPTSEISSCE